MKLQTIKDLLYILFHPDWWISDSIDKEWDKKLNEILDNNPTVFYEPASTQVPYTAILNDGENQVEVWVQNFPYSYGGFYYSPRDAFTPIESGAPTRRTRLRLWRLLKKNPHGWERNHPTWNEIIAYRLAREGDTDLAKKLLEDDGVRH